MRAAQIELSKLPEQAAPGRQPETDATVAQLMDRYAAPRLTIDPSSGKPAWLPGCPPEGRIPRAAECVKLACLIWRPIAVVEASGARPVPDSICRADAGGWMAAYRARDLAALARRPRPIKETWRMPG
jgi:hypothetical protein